MTIGGSKLYPNLILFSGYAKLPTRITVGEMYRTIGVILIIDVKNGQIVDADCTLATDLASRHIARALTGHNINEGPEILGKIVDRIYQGGAKRAIITAIKLIYDKYRNFMAEYEVVEGI